MYSRILEYYCSINDANDLYEFIFHSRKKVAVWYVECDSHFVFCNLACLTLRIYSRIRLHQLPHIVISYVMPRTIGVQRKDKLINAFSYLQFAFRTKTGIWFRQFWVMADEFTNFWKVICFCPILYVANSMQLDLYREFWVIPPPPRFIYNHIQRRLSVARVLFDSYLQVEYILLFMAA